MLPRKLRLTKSAEYSRIYKKGRVITSPHLRLFFLQADQNLIRFGFVVSKKQVLRIVDRNRVKRMLRAQIRSLLPRFVCGFEAVLLARPGIRGLAKEDILRELIFVFQKAKLFNG